MNISRATVLFIVAMSQAGVAAGIVEGFGKPAPRDGTDLGGEQNHRWLSKSSKTYTPTNTPTLYPTVSPTLYPTTSPSMSPTYCSKSGKSCEKGPRPSGSGSSADVRIRRDLEGEQNHRLLSKSSKTYTPTSTPTDPPTNTPTLYPTVSPTLYPTMSPSMSPTYCSKSGKSCEKGPRLSGSSSSADRRTTRKLQGEQKSKSSKTYAPTSTPTDPPTVTPTLYPTVSPSMSPTYCGKSGKGCKKGPRRSGLDSGDARRVFHEQLLGSSDSDGSDIIGSKTGVVHESLGLGPGEHNRRYLGSGKPKDRGELEPEKANPLRHIDDGGKPRNTRQAS